MYTGNFPGIPWNLLDLPQCSERMNRARRRRFMLRSTALPSPAAAAAAARPPPSPAASSCRARCAAPALHDAEVRRTAWASQQDDEARQKRQLSSSQRASQLTGSCAARALVARVCVRDCAWASACACLRVCCSQTRPGRQQALSGGGRHTDDRSVASVRGTINGSAARHLSACVHSPCMQIHMATKAKRAPAEDWDQNARVLQSTWMPDVRLLR